MFTEFKGIFKHFWGTSEEVQKSIKTENEHDEYSLMYISVVFYEIIMIFPHKTPFPSFFYYQVHDNFDLSTPDRT